MAQRVGFRGRFRNKVALAKRAVDVHLIGTALGAGRHMLVCDRDHVLSAVRALDCHRNGRDDALRAVRRLHRNGGRALGNGRDDAVLRNRGDFGRIAGVHYVFVCGVVRPNLKRELVHIAQIYGHGVHVCCQCIQVHVQKGIAHVLHKVVAVRADHGVFNKSVLARRRQHGSRPLDLYKLHFIFVVIVLEEGADIRIVARGAVKERVLADARHVFGDRKHAGQALAVVKRAVAERCYARAEIDAAVQPRAVFKRADADIPYGARKNQIAGKTAAAVKCGLSDCCCVTAADLLNEQVGKAAAVAKRLVPDRL